MLKIRSEQLEALSQVPKAEFENRMTVHVGEHFPTHFEALGEEKCRQLIQYGIEQAATHDFISERDVCKFIDLMVCCGVQFDNDDQQTWAREILEDESWLNVTAKMDALFDAGINHLKNSPP